MKKVIIMISMVGLASMAMAQQGSWYIGGLVGYNSDKDEPTGDVETVTSSWDLSPEIGTFLKDDIQLGFILGIGGSKVTVDGDETFKSSSLSPTVYGRKFFKIDDNFSTFAGLYLNLISGKSTDASDIETKDSGFGTTIGVGVAYALSERFTAVGQYGLFGFESVTRKVDGDETGKRTELDFGMNTVGGSVFNIGIYYTFKQ